MNNKLIETCSFLNCKIKPLNPKIGFCIFHDPDRHKDLHSFDEEFKKLINNNDQEPSIKEYRFTGFIFPRDYIINKLKFTKELYLDSVVGQGSIEFHLCNFEKIVIFNKSKFYGDLKFNRCIFFDQLKFHKIKIIKNGNFIFYDCESLNHFQMFGSTISKSIVFDVSNFKGEFRILDTKAKESWYFHVIDFNKAERARIHNIDMTNSYFWGSIIHNLDFLDVKWQQVGNRYIIADERLIDENKNLRYFKRKPKHIEIEHIYMQLVQNFEKNGLYTESSKFYISAMEMRRKSKRNWFVRNIFCLEAWYKLVSLYGQSAGRAFFCIFFIFVLFSLLLTSISNSSNIISNNIIAELFNSAKGNFLLLINPPDLTFQLINNKYFLIGFERLLIIVLVTIYILALRRRFKRS